MHSKIAFKCTMLKIVTTVKLEMFVGAFVYKSSLLPSQCSCSPRSALWGAGLIPKSSCVPCPHRVPQPGRDEGHRAVAELSGTPILLPGDTRSFPNLPPPEPAPPSPTGREIILLQGEGSCFPATNGGFTMGMHLFVRAGFIFMEKVLRAGVVPGESAGRPPHARSCRCGRGSGGPGQAAQGHQSPAEGTLAKEVSGFFILPLQKTSSLENTAKQEPEVPCF